MANPIQQNLAAARTDLLNAQAKVHQWRQAVAGLTVPEGETLGDFLTTAIYEKWVQRRHAAADRVWELQCMSDGAFR